MSAIAGVYYRDGAPRAVDALVRLMARMRHHGPDGQGRWDREEVAVGHLALCSLPAARCEAMPARDEVRGLVLTADARLDNRDDLCRYFGIAPAERAATPDGALIRLAYARWGLDCPAHLIGDFAFALWDERERRFFCATDPMSRRPLYYHLDPRLFAFASEAGALLDLPGVDARLDEVGLSNVLVGGVEAEDPGRTCFAGVHALPAGCSLVVDASASARRTYWAPDPGRRLSCRSDDDVFEAFRELFAEAVRCRTQTPGAVASLLSGGLDSSAVVCMAARELRREGRTLFAVSSVLPEGYAGPEKDERYYIDLVRDQENLEVAYVTAEGWPLFGESLERYFGQTGSFSMTYFPYRYDALFHAAAERGARVMLDGGGGEYGPTFHGYGFHVSLALRGRWVRLAREVRAMAEKQGVPARRLWRSKVLAPLLPSRLRAGYRRRKGEGLIGRLDQSVIRPDFAARSGVMERVRRSSALVSYPHRSTRANQVWMIERSRQPSAFWAREKRVETVFPYQDVRLIEFCLAAPDEVKVRGGWKRYLIRRAMEGVLPREIQWRTTKEPFSPDHFRRLWRAREEMGRQVEAARKRELVRAYLDVEKMEGALRRVRACSSEATAMASGPVRQAMVTLQNGLYAIRFLQWFDAARS
jgi:asparagine synthase (glutamine-hydrolysing)